ncbi:MAG TPA: SUMF1/EgtB/PvdO family nonheme iron enzyme [Verrucomicrobiae bacterium]|nr:SUMF1/EgtB/PvdO family nonheme iron enzyme [Verrucomicrobiae bacterium]
MNHSGSEPPPLWEIEFRVADLTSEQTAIPRERIKPDSRLFEDLNIDSLDMVALILAVEEEFDVAIPDDIGQQMFVRQPVTIGVLAEIVRHQWGTGAPERKGWFATKAAPPVAAATPFTQLGGTASERDWLEGSLYEPMAATPEGCKQFRRRTDGMRCVLLPAAEVELGTHATDALPDQRPAHRATLTSFLVDAEPVSVRAFARFLNSVDQGQAKVISEWCGVENDDRRGQHFQLKHHRNQWHPLIGVEQQPMILVSWFGANAYALWANRRDWRWFRGDGTMPESLHNRLVGAAGRSAPSPASFLPTEAQWEYAARGANAKSFPWGDAPATVDRARVALHTARATYPNTLPLAGVTDKLGMSPFGLHHMAGNVWNWCADWYGPDFYQRTEACRPNPQNLQPSGVRCERGGSWIGPADLARSSYRRGRPPSARGRCLGFRCVGLGERLSELITGL